MRPLLVVAVAISGCWSATPPGSIATPTATSSRPRGPDYHAAIADPLGFLPREAEIVGAIDVAHLREGALWQTWEPAIREHSGVDATPIGRCLGDLAASVGSITIAFTGTHDKVLGGIAVARGLDARALRTCLSGRRDVVTFEGDTILATNAASVSHDPWHLAARSVGDDTIVAVFGATATARDLDAALAAHASLADEPRFDGAVAQVDQHRAAWFALGKGAKPLESFQAVGFAPEVVFAWLDATDFLSATAHVRLASPAEATSLQSMATTQLGSAKGFVERLDINLADRDVVLELAINATQLTQLLGLLGLTPP